MQAKIPTPVGAPLSDSTSHYTGFTFNNHSYSISSNVFLPADCYRFPVKQRKANKKPKKNPGWVESDRDDETKFPELYRKSEYIKGSNLDVPTPFQIGQYLAYMYIPLCTMCMCIMV